MVIPNMSQSNKHKHCFLNVSIREYFSDFNNKSVSNFLFYTNISFILYITFLFCNKNVLFHITLPTEDLLCSKMACTFRDDMEEVYNTNEVVI